MRKIDDMTIREFQVDVLILMENAGRAAAVLARQMLLGQTIGKRVACLVGGGNNGGDGKVGARHFAKWGGRGKGVSGKFKDRRERGSHGQLNITEKKGRTKLSKKHHLGGFVL